MKNWHRSFVSILFIFLFSASVHADHPVTIKDAWIADAPPVSRIRAGYLSIHNTGSNTITIKSFTSKEFDKVELHKTVVADGMIKMEEINQLQIEPGKMQTFEPGGYHLMLFTPKHKLKVGDKVTFTLTLEDKSTTTFTSIVRKRGKGKHMMDHNHHKCGGGKCGGK